MTTTGQLLNKKPKPTIMKAETMTITPGMAEALLEKNTNNRRVNARTVKRYASDMAAGVWKLNGEAIIMNGDRLLDGQHRLLACVQAGMPFTTLVVSGVASDTFDTIDQGDKRTAANVLSMDGIPNATVVASAVRWIKVLENSDGKTSLGLGSMGSVTAAAVRSFYYDNLDIADSVRKAQVVYSGCKAFVPSTLAALHFLAARSNKSLADQFIEPLASGEGLTAGDPRLTLRNRMLERAMRLHKERPEWVTILHIYAWNAFVDGRKLTKLVYRDGDAVPKIKLS